MVALMKKRVIIFNPPLHFKDGVPTDLDVSVPPLGILYVAAYVNRYSETVSILPADMGSRGMTLDEGLALLEEEDIIAAGISSMTPQLQGALELGQAIKTRFPDLPVFLGGAHVTADPGFVERHADAFDHGILGEGEAAFLSGVELLAQGEKPPRLMTSEFLKELDTIPFPERHHLAPYFEGQRASMIYSRGCPYQCYDCSRPAISKKVRYRSPENMLEEIRQEYDACGGRIDFQDDTFTIHRKNTLALCDAIMTSGLKLDWQCNTRVDLIDAELLGRMREAGCTLIHFGIESGSEALRQEVILKGKFTNDQIREAFENCYRAGVKVGGYFMIGHQHETEEQMEQTKKLILQAKIDILGVSIPTPFPGSPLYEMAVGDEIISTQVVDQFANKELGEGYAGNYPVYISSNLSPKAVFEKRKEIIRSFYLRPRIMLAFLRENIGSVQGVKKLVLDGLSVVFRGSSVRQPYRYKPKKAHS